MQNNSSVPGEYFQITDNSMDGLYTWSGLAVLATLFGGLLFELLRRTKSMHRILYTRMHTTSSPAPAFPSGLFGWVYQAYSTDEAWISENTGLDAVMFLRFLTIAFRFCLFALFAVFPALTAVHYFATGTSSDHQLVYDSKGHAVEVTVTLNQFSIVNVPSGSNWFYIHVFYAYVLTGALFYLFYHGYKSFADVAIDYLKDTSIIAKQLTPWRRAEVMQLRSVLIQNIPIRLQSDELLKAYIESLGIGDVKSVCLDRIASSATRKISKKRDKILSKLEHAYISWGDKILVTKKSQSNVSLLLRTTSFLGITQKSTDAIELDPAIMWECRPKFKILLNYHLSTLEADTDDQIDFYTDQLHLLTAQLKQKRLIAIQSDMKNINHSLCSSTGFVTFMTQRAAQIAAQTLLHQDMSPSSFKVTPAPAPQDVNWESIGANRWRKLAIRHAVTGFCFVLCLFISFPTSLIASALNTESLAKLAFLKSFLLSISDTPRIRILIETVIPQFIVGMMNYSIVPLVLQALSRFQGYNSHSRRELAMFSKYFIFLFLNTFIIFTIAGAFWSIVTGFVRNPLMILQQLPQLLPSGAPFFINYIITNIILYTLELLRPSSTIYTLLAIKFFLKTPREFHQNSLITSYVDYGWIYPQFVLGFIIILCYSLISPIILIPGTLYFAFGILVFKNQLMYVYVKEFESYGRHFIMAFNRAMIGVAVFQITLLGILLLKDMITAAVLVSLLLPCTLGFFHHCQSTFETRTRFVPLDQLSQEPHSLPGSMNGLNSTISTPQLAVRCSQTLRFSQAMRGEVSIDRAPTPQSTLSPSYTHRDNNADIESGIDFEDAGVREATPVTTEEQDFDTRHDQLSRRISFMEDVVYTSDAYETERYNQSYLNPIFSRAIQRPWIPTYYAEMFSIAKKGNQKVVILGSVNTLASDEAIVKERVGSWHRLI